MKCEIGKKCEVLFSICESVSSRSLCYDIKYKNKRCLAMCYVYLIILDYIHDFVILQISGFLAISMTTSKKG